jgi:hypothetical protein
MSDKIGARIETLDRTTGESRVYQVVEAYIAANARQDIVVNSAGILALRDAPIRLILEETCRDGSDATKSTFDGQDITLHSFWPFTAAAGTTFSHGTGSGTYSYVTTGTQTHLPEIEVRPGTQTLQSDFSSFSTAGMPENMWNTETRVATLADQSQQYTQIVYGSAFSYRPSDFGVTSAGDYTSISGVQASVTVIQELTTRIGMLTYAAYETLNKFRFIFEYNPHGLNNNVGFRDNASGRVVLTFSHVYTPRTEFIGVGSDRLALMKASTYGDGDGYIVNGRQVAFTRSSDLETQNTYRKYQRQVIAKRLGFTGPSGGDVWGQTIYIPFSQWSLETHAYRLLKLTFDGQDNSDDKVRHLSTVRHVEGGELNQETVFLKMSVPSAFNTIRFQPSTASFRSGIRNLKSVRVQLLNYDLTPFNLHGRDISVSLMFTTVANYR